MLKAQIVHTLNGLNNHIPNTLDPFFARGRVATFLKKQALALAYFKPLDHPYEVAIEQIHRDFALPGEPFAQGLDLISNTTPLPADLVMIRKHFQDTSRGARRIEVDHLWTIEGNGSIVLRPAHPGIVCFESLDLISGRILYNHELESVSAHFTHFLVKDDFYTFSRLAEDIHQRNK